MGASFRDATINTADFSGADLTEADFSGAEGVEDAIFLGARISRGSFTKKQYDLLRERKTAKSA